MKGARWASTGLQMESGEGTTSRRRISTEQAGDARWKGEVGGSREKRATQKLGREEEWL